ncbi:MAG: hypothetical protein J6J41_03295 [Clostridia bacterium]|nr:hypothetical protein [Clostridia bacterium]
MYSDPTANRAIGSVGREWRRMAESAYLYRTGRLLPADRAAFDRQFTGIYARLLTDSLELLEQQLPRELKRKLGLL